MNFKRAAGVMVVVMATFCVTACGNMSHRDRNTAIGAGVGALGGLPCLETWPARC